MKRNPDDPGSGVSSRLLSLDTTVPVFATNFGHSLGSRRIPLVIAFFSLYIYGYIGVYMVVSSNGRKRGFHPRNMGSIPVTATIRQAFNHYFQSLKGNQEALTRI